MRRRMCVTAVCVIALSSIMAGPSPSAEDHTYQVLIVVSMDQGVPWTDGLLMAIQHEFASPALEVELHIDYLHTKRIKIDPTYLRDKATLLSDEFKKLRFDVVICCGVDAARLVSATSDKLFPDTPVVFCAISPVHAAQLEHNPLYATLYLGLGLKDALSLSLKLFPGTKELALVYDQTPGVLGIVAGLHAVEPQLPGLRFRPLTNLDYSELMTEVSRLPNESVLFPVGYSVDKSGRAMSQSRATRTIIAASPVPAMGLFREQLDFGIVGGYLINFPEHGKAAGRAAIEILHGQSPRRIRTTSTFSHYAFNYPQLQKYGVPESRLPRGSVVLGRPPSLFEQYRTLALQAIGVLAALVAVIVVLSVNIVRRKHAEQARLDFERDTNRQKRGFYRDTILSVTEGKLLISEPQDVECYECRAEMCLSVREPSEVSEARTQVRAYLKQKGLGDDQLALFIMGVGEAITNAVKHALEGNVCAGTEDGMVWVGVTDKGSGIDSLILPQVALKKGFSTKVSLGMGYSIMLDGADRILLSTGSSGTTVILMKNLVEPPPGTRLADLADAWDRM